MSQHPYIIKLISHRKAIHCSLRPGLKESSRKEGSYSPLRYCWTHRHSSQEILHWIIRSSQEQLLTEVEKQSHPIWGISLKTDSTFALITHALFSWYW